MLFVLLFLFSTHKKGQDTDGPYFYGKTKKETLMKKTIFLAGLLIITATPALAATENTNWASGFYATASFGQTKAHATDTVLFSTDKTDTGYSLGLGYTFNKYVAIEAGYADLGEMNRDYADGIGAVNIKSEADGFYFGPQISLPVTDAFSIFGKVGLFAWDVDEKVSASGAYAATNGLSASAHGTDVYFGAGMAYAITDTLSVKAEWIRYNNVGDKDTTDSADVDFISAGLTFKFGRLL
jgi:OOP family OmpA-OmpF porin